MKLNTAKTFLEKYIISIVLKREGKPLSDVKWQPFLVEIRYLF